MSCYYGNQMDEEAVAEESAISEQEDQTMMEVAPNKPGVQASIIAAVGVILAALIYVTVPRLWPEPRPPMFKLSADDIFGGLKDTDHPAVLLLKDPDNNKKLVTLFNSAQIGIKIVTVTGSSWLLSDLLRTPFEDALKRSISIDLLIFDYRNSPYYDFVQKATILQQLARMSRADYAENLRRYAPFLSNPAYNFKLSLYQDYPWVRFSIYDDNAVSFIIVPTMRSGLRVKKFYSEDPWVIRCFNEIFTQFKRRSLSVPSPEVIESYIDSLDS